MLWLVSAFGTTLCFGINNTLFKWGTTRNLSKMFLQFIFYAVAFLLVLLVAFLKHDLHPSWSVALYGSLIGILNANGNIQMTRAFEKGPASITSTLIAMNSIIVILATAIFYPEPISLLHWAGILLMIGAAIVVQYQPSRTTQRFAYKPWLLRCGLAIVSIGCVGFVLKMVSYQHVDFFNMLVSMYGGGTVFLAFFVQKDLAHLTEHKTEMKLASIIGIVSTVGYACYLFALQNGPASVVYPVISLNCIVVMFAGLLLFKERLKTYQLFGIVFALCGLVLTKV
jgi:drug/metabolite transporter (DMT)-like permease